MTKRYNWGMIAAAWSMSIVPAGLVLGIGAAIADRPEVIRWFAAAYVGVPAAALLLWGLAWIAYHLDRRYAAGGLVGVWIFGGFVGSIQSLIVAGIISMLWLVGVALRFVVAR